MLPYEPYEQKTSAVDAGANHLTRHQSSKRNIKWPPPQPQPTGPHLVGLDSVPERAPRLVTNHHTPPIHRSLVNNNLRSVTNLAKHTDFASQKNGRVYKTRSLLWLSQDGEVPSLAL
jgi:hypothetical protein